MQAACSPSRWQITCQSGRQAVPEAPRIAATHASGSLTEAQVQKVSVGCCALVLSSVAYDLSYD